MKKEGITINSLLRNISHLMNDEIKGYVSRENAADAKEQEEIMSAYMEKKRKLELRGGLVNSSSSGSAGSVYDEAIFDLANSPQKKHSHQNDTMLSHINPQSGLWVTRQVQLYNC